MGVKLKPEQKSQSFDFTILYYIYFRQAESGELTLIFFFNLTQFFHMLVFFTGFQKGNRNALNVWVRARCS